MINHIKRVIAEYLKDIMQPKFGTVTAYNPNNYTVKVMIQPEGIETGFIQIATPWAGSGFGAVFGPAVGDLVRLDFIEGSVQASLMGGRFFSATQQPPVVQSGQCAIVDSGGSSIKLNGDGTATVTTTGGVTVNAGAATLAISGNITSNATAWNHTGPLTVAGLITGSAGLSIAGGSGAVIAGSVSVTGDVVASGKSLVSHVHSGVTAGTANSGPPV